MQPQAAASSAYTGKVIEKDTFMETLALLLVFPLAWPFVAKLIFKHELTVPEIGANIAAGVIVVVIGYFGGSYHQMRDIEIINGQVVGKESKKVSCEHSYSCNCRQSCSGSGESTSCTTTCDTCYEHDYDVNWLLSTTLGTIKISRVNRQGTKEPPRYTRAQKGDPVALRHAYENYIKAAPDSLFNTAVERGALAKFEGRIPAYPNKVYDYHYVDRVLAVGLTVPELKEWNQELALRLRSLGPAKQVNVAIVFVNESDPAFATALRAAWLGGKKNDVIVVAGTPAYPAVEWVRVLSWTDKEVFKVELRDELFFQKMVDRKNMLDTIEKHVATTFTRKSMKDFAYLKDEISPPTWMLIVLFLLSAISSVGISVAFSRNTYSERSFGF